MKRFSQNAGIIAIAVTIMALAGVVGLLRGAAEGTTPPASPADSTEIQELRAALQRENLSEEGRRALEEKLAIAEQMAAPQSAVDQAALDAKMNAPFPAQESSARVESLEEQFPEALFEGSEGLIRPSIADVVNGWQGVRGSTALQIFAGAMPDDPAVGVVVVLRVDPDAMTRTMHVYPAPTGIGRLRIAEVHDFLVILTDTAGTALSFDWVTGEYAVP